MNLCYTSTATHVHNGVVMTTTVLDLMVCVLVLFTLMHTCIVIRPQVFVNKKFVDLHPITKIVKILSHRNLNIYRAELW